MDHNSSSVRERVAFLSRLDAFVRDTRSRGFAAEHLKLETCNRVELYMVCGGDERNAPSELAAGARVMYDYEAVRHLLRVLLGLESMARGESHIVSQVKSAYGSSDGCGKVLHRLFQRAIGMAASLRSVHPGREPSLPRIAAGHYLENSGSGRPVMVAGMGEVGRETVCVLRPSGRGILITNRTLRQFGEKFDDLEFVPWETWKDRARECGAVFLCTSSPTPILSSGEADAMPGVWVMDLGSPCQSERRSSGVRITLDEMKEISDGILDDYGKSLVALENEADRASGALLAEISVLTDETWKHLALSRAHAIAKERASSYAGRTGVTEGELEAFAASVLKAFLHPLVAERNAHSSRAWRILSGEMERNEPE
jgi:glutamyl-tRNA reductase